MTTINIFRHARDVTTFEPGDIVFTQGDPGDFMYAVVNGTVDISRDGKVIESIGEGGILGELALVDRSPRGATATAVTSARLAPVDEQQFMFLVHEHPTFALTVMRVMAQRLRAANIR